VARRSCKQSSISAAELRPSYLPAQHLELVPEHEQLHILHIRTAPATNKQTKQSPHREIKQRDEHRPILAATSPKPPRHE